MAEISCLLIYFSRLGWFLLLTKACRKRGKQELRTRHPLPGAAISRSKLSSAVSFLLVKGPHDDRESRFPLSKVPRHYRIVRFRHYRDMGAVVRSRHRHCAGHRLRCGEKPENVVTEDAAASFMPYLRSVLRFRRDPVWFGMSVGTFLPSFAVCARLSDLNL